MSARVTVSIGVAGVQPEAEHVPQWLIARADAALYRSKQSGRNCVTEAEG